MMEGWSTVLNDESVALRSPMQYAPKIEAAISEKHSLGLKAAACPLLAAAPLLISIGHMRLFRKHCPGLYALAPTILNALKIVKPETVVRWHRACFRAYWRWKSRPRGGRPTIPSEICQLIREMSVANRFSNRPIRVKRFQTIHHFQCRTHSSRLEQGPKRGCRHPQSRTSPALIPRLSDLSSVM